MSYISLFEINAQLSSAIIVLNDIRHFLQRRRDAQVTPYEQSVIKKAMKIRNLKNKTELIMYNLRSIAGSDTSTSVTISLALNEAIRNITLKKAEQETLLQNLYSLIMKKDFKSFSDKEIDTLKDLISEAIHAINNKQVEETPAPLWQQ